VRQAVSILGLILFTFLSFAVFYFFGLATAIVLIIAVNFVVTAVSFTSRWPARGQH
jgi:hypothetical protein